MEADLQIASARDPRSPRPAVERKQRRALAEQLLAALVPTAQVVSTIATRFRISERAAWADIRHIRRAWQRIDAKTSAFNRSLFVRRCLHLSAVAEREKDLGNALRAVDLAARLLGFLRPPAVSAEVNLSHGGTTLLELIKAADEAGELEPRDGEIAVPLLPGAPPTP